MERVGAARIQRAASPQGQRAQCIYRLDRLTLALDTRGSGCREEVEQLLAPFPMTETDADVGVPDLQVVVTLTDGPWRPPSTVGAQPAFGLQIAERGLSTYVWGEAAVFRTCPADGTGRLSLHRSFLDQPRLERYNLFLLGLFPLLLERGYYDLHAAAVIHQGAACLFVGESGSGKSTSALSLVAQGCGYLSDDALLLSRTPNGIEAIGFRRKISIDPALTRQWPELATHLEDPVTPGEYKRFVDLDRVYPGSRRESAQPRVLIFPRIVHHSRSRITPMDPTTALVRLLPQSASLAFNCRSAQAQIDVLRELVQQAAAYELFAGQDLHERPAMIAELVPSWPRGSL